MAFTVIDYPNEQANANVNTVSYWVGINNPVTVTVQRRDAEFTSITFNSVVLATINSIGIGTTYGGTVTAPFEIEIAESNLPTGTYTVTNVSTNYFQIDITGLGYTAISPPATAGYLNIYRDNYYVQTDVEVAGVAVGSCFNKQASILSNIKVNVSEYLKNALSYSDTFAYDVINKKDTNRGNYFYPFMRGCYVGYTGVQESTTPYFTYFTNAVFQMGSTFNGNMAEYCTFDNYGTNKSFRAKFLSDFEKPTYFEGYPFSLDFIFNADIDTITYDLNRHETTYNKNGGLVNTYVTAMDDTQSGGVNRFMIRGNYASNVKHTLVWIETESAI